MATKKEKTRKKPEPKTKDFMTFVRDASKKKSDIGKQFLDMLNKKEVKETEVKDFLKSWHYEIPPGDVRLLLKFCKNSSKLKDGVAESGY